MKNVCYVSKKFDVVHYDNINLFLDYCLKCLKEKPLVLSSSSLATNHKKAMNFNSKKIDLKKWNKARDLVQNDLAKEKIIFNISMSDTLYNFELMCDYGENSINAINKAILYLKDYEKRETNYMFWQMAVKSCRETRQNHRNRKNNNNIQQQERA